MSSKIVRRPLIGGGVLFMQKSKGQVLDHFICKTPNEIFYLTMLFHQKIENREMQNSNIRKAVKLKVFANYNNKCVRCNATENLTIDHIIPRSKGGGNSNGNLQLMCYECNQEKRNSTNFI
jgi:5-methylcytosine-specific restriction endonuclease McrA